MKRACDRIAEVDNGKLELFSGGFDYWQREKVGHLLHPVARM